MNTGLREIWQDEIAGVNIPDEAAWESHVADVFPGPGTPDRKVTDNEHHSPSFHSRVFMPVPEGNTPSLDMQ
jgi:hypothetical protein